jgi:hypothetical protein
MSNLYFNRSERRVTSNGRAVARRLDVSAGDLHVRCIESGIAAPIQPVPGPSA